MVRVVHSDDDWGDDADDVSDADLAAADDDSADDAFVCPACHGPVHEETVKCPHCGDWITPVERSASRRGTVILIIVVLMVILALAWVLH